MTPLVPLCLAAFVAGFVDAIVGGGGLIQLPALLVVLPEAPVATVFGTNKLASFAGTSVALYRYAQTIAIPWRQIGPGAAFAFGGSFLGARLVSLIPSDILRPLVLVLLIGVAVYTAWRKDFGKHARKPPERAVLIGIALGLGIGFYDGFFGPGTGSFFVFAFVGLLGMGFLEASAGAKLCNMATNLAALAWFLPHGSVRYDLALPMGACNIAGSVLGTRLAILHGSGFVRTFFLLVVSGLILKIAWDLG